MAAPTDAELVRSLADVTDDDYDDAYIDSLVERAGSDYGAVALLWLLKAASYAKSVGAASGSTRLEMQQRFEHARSQAEYYKDMAGGIGDAGDSMVSVTMAAAFEDDSTEYTWDGNGWPSAGLWATWEREF